MSKTTKGKKPAPEKVSTLTSLIPPWPVWTDAALNSEKWDAAVPGVDQREKKPPSSEFSDPAGHGELPASLVVSTWVRAPEIFPKLSVVANDKASPYDLITMNTHLLNSRLIQTLLSDMSSLMYLAGVKPFPVEMQDLNYIPNGGAIWKPWHHVYAQCKAGKGVKHKPAVNNAGKYIIRLFYLGKWRKITVDDYIPVDEGGKPLLPVTPVEGELWLPLLAKALVRIASFSWSDEDEVDDFSVVTCLTGWLPQSFICSDIPLKYIWCMCQKLLLPNTEDEKQKYSGIPQDNVIPSPYASPATEGQRVQDPLYEMKTSEEMEVLGSVVMFAATAEKPRIVLHEQPKAPYSGQSVLITDADIYTASDRPSTPLWKKFRWKEWAIRTGLLKDAEREVKRVKIFVPIRDPTTFPESEKELEASSSAPSTDDEEKSKSSKKNKTKKEKKKGKKEGSKKSGKASIAFSDLDEWLYLTDLIPYLENLVVYYRPSCFNNILTLSDMTFLEDTDCKPADAISLKEKGKLKETGVNCISVSTARECFYHSFCFLTDNIYSKKVLFSLSVFSDIVERKYNMRVSKDKEAVKKVSKLQNYHVIGEDYTWSSTSFGKVLFCLRTNGVKTALLQLREGMCSMRIWLKAPQNFSLIIMSQVPFTLGSLEKLQQLVSNVSASIAYFGATIAQSFANLQKTAGKEHAEKVKQLEEFYASYKPKYFASEFITKSPSLIEEINNAFEKAVIEIMLERAGSDVDALTNNLRHFQQLLTRSNFGIDALKELDVEKADVINAKFEEELKVMEQQVEGEIKEDSKKSPKVKRKKEKEKKSPKSPKSSQSSRKGKAKDTPCSFFETPEVCSELLARMIKICPIVLNLYPFREDLKKKMISEDYRGEIKLTKSISSDRWQVIVRFILNTHCEENCLGALFFIASIKKFVFRLINNDTTEETPVYPFGCLPITYSRNNKGYTFIAYGVPDPIAEKEIKWYLRIISYDAKCLLHRCPTFEDTSSECKHLPPKEVIIKEVRSYYIPNSEKRICRCILTTSYGQFLSLRFYFSKDKARFHVVVTEINSNETIIDMEGVGSLLIPVLHLEAPVDDIELSGEESVDEQTLDTKSRSAQNGTKIARPPLALVAEAFVIRDSWYLTNEEKEKVKVLKDVLASSGLGELSGTESHIAITSGIFQKRQSSRPKPLSTSNRKGLASDVIRRTAVNDLPFWSLQVAVDADRAAETTLEIDTQREEEIRQMKLQWERADPGRRKRAHSLRAQFVEERSRLPREPLEIQKRTDSMEITNILEEILKPVGEVVVDEEFSENLKTSVNQSLGKLDRFRSRMNNKHERILWRQGHCNQLVEKDLSEKRLHSEHQLTTAYNERSAYVEQLAPKQPPTKQKGSKKKKK